MSDLTEKITYLKESGAIILFIDENESSDPGTAVKKICNKCSLYDLMEEYYIIDSQLLSLTGKGQKCIDFLLGTSQIITATKKIQM